MYFEGNLYGFDTVPFGFVFDVLVAASERPNVLPRRLRDVLADVGQVLEHDARTVILDGFFDKFVRQRVQVRTDRTPSDRRSRY